LLAYLSSFITSYIIIFRHKKRESFFCDGFSF